jgi:hypothetical protein
MTSCEQLEATIREAGLGPVVVVETIRATEGTPETIRVVLDPGYRRKAALLRRWLTLVTARDMVMGRFRVDDDRVNLNIRGFLPSGVPVILVAPFSDHQEHACTSAIAVAVRGQQVGALVEQLVALEERHG